MALQEPNTEMSAALQLPSAADESATVSAKRRVSRAIQDGLRFGKYQVVHLIAVGGMSEVYEAVHLGLQKHVALKVMRPELAENPDARRRFVSEGVHAARIRHTNVVDVSDVGMVDELPYLVMELLVGEDLGVVYDRQKALPITDLVDILLPVSSAVAEGHAKGVVHRDLKPENVFLHREGRRLIPKVLDFGVSRVLNTRRTTLSASVLGTPHYMSPEQARGDGIDERTDQYSLGVMLYEGATGRLPRDHANPLQLLHSVAYDEFEPPSKFRELPDGLEAVILRAMSRDPEARYANMQELARALVPYASESARESWEFELTPRTRDDSGEVSLPIATRYSSSSGLLRPVCPSCETAAAAALANGQAHAHAHTARASGASAPASPPPIADAPSGVDLAAISGVRMTPVDRAHMTPIDNAPAPVPAVRKVFGVRAGYVVSIGLVVGGSVIGVQRWTHTTTSAPTLAQPQAPLATFEVDVTASPGHATLELDGMPVGVGHYHGALRKDGAQHELRLAAAGYAEQNVRFQDAAPPAAINLVPLSLNAASASPSLASVATEPGAAGRKKLGKKPAKSGALSVSADSNVRLADESAELGLGVEPSATEASASGEQGGGRDQGRNARPAQRPRVRVVDVDAPRVRLVN